MIGLVAATVTTVIGGEVPLVMAIGLLLVFGFLLAFPALLPVVPDRLYVGPMTLRGIAIMILVVLTVLVALPSIPFNLFVVGGNAVPGDGGVEVGDYTVTYERNVTPGQQLIVGPDGDVDEEAVPLDTRQSGLIVVNDNREIWTVMEPTAVIAHEGNVTVEIGGFDWREEIYVDRTGWDVVGNESAYVVDLTVDGETTRSFASNPVRASATIDGQAIEVDPTADAFLLRVIENGDMIGEGEIPDVNETTSVGDIEFSTEVVESDDANDSPGNEDESVRLFASVDDTGYSSQNGKRTLTRQSNFSRKFSE